MPRNRWSKRPEEGSYPRPHPWVALFLFTLALQGCSIKGMAMNSLADALSGQGDGGSVYLSDNDPALVGGPDMIGAVLRFIAETGSSPTN